MLFGHEVQGRNLGTGEAYRRATADDGTTRVNVGDWSDTGRSQIEGDLLCFLYPSDGSNLHCHFPQSLGTLAQKNEYFFITQWDRFEFSVVK